MNVSPFEGHRIWAATYDESPNPMLALELRTLLPRLGDLRGRKFVDAACGTGRWLAEACSRGASAAGVDLSLEMLARTKRKTGRQVAIACADLLHPPLPYGWADIVVCAFSLAYVPALGEAVRSLARLLKLGGRLYISDIHPEGRRRGWTRSFRSGPEVYKIDHYFYTLEDLAKAGADASLTLTSLLEPCFGEPEKDIFRRAGRDHLFEEAAGVPALFVAEWEARP
jgi:SAM-dependent methyltransferase